VGSENVFAQEQNESAELGFGVQSPKEIKVTALNSEAERESERICRVLNAQVLMH
jgi:hypothetical protein